MDILAQRYDFSTMSILHLSPEWFLRDRFAKEFGTFTTGNLDPGPGIDLVIDLTDTDLPDETYDVVAGTVDVFEHIVDDLAAARTVHRILKPGGFAVLPAPIPCDATLQEFPERVETEYGHVRGPDPTTSTASPTCSTSSASPPRTSTTPTRCGSTRTGRATR